MHVKFNRLPPEDYIGLELVDNTLGTLADLILYLY